MSFRRSPQQEFSQGSNVEGFGQNEVNGQLVFLAPIHDFPISGYHDDHLQWQLRFNRHRQLLPGHARHCEIGENEIELTFCELLQSGFSPISRFHPMAIERQEDTDRRSHYRLIVDHQNALGRNG